jgi:agmatine deiminase
MNTPPAAPSELGYRMPAEWEPHSATWLSWPRREGISFPGSYDSVMPALAAMVDALADSEPVHINVSGTEHEADVRLILANARARTEHVRFFHIPTNEPWCRDHGPIFLTRKEPPQLTILDWGYNAWGGKYPPFDNDDVVPTRVAAALGLPVLHPGMVLEGGSIDVNGQGTLLTTKSCLLNPNRNPELNEAQISENLRKHLGVTKILWLGDGIEGDDTDGHIDDLTRFVGPHTVVTVVEKDPEDSNYEPLKTNLELLKTMETAEGVPLEIRELPMPSRIVREDLRLPASYANFYIANQVVLLPVFSDPNDGEAISVLQSVFEGRKIVPIDCRELIWGLGAFHCLTQQQPSI